MLERSLLQTPLLSLTALPGEIAGCQALISQCVAQPGWGLLPAEARLLLSLPEGLTPGVLIYRSPQELERCQANDRKHHASMAG